MKSSIKAGQQFLIDFPGKGVSVVVCTGKLEGGYDFLHYIDGEYFHGSSLRLTDKDIEQGTFNIRPIDETHPAYIKDWEDNPMLEVFKALKKMESVGKAGGSDDECFGALFGSIAKSISKSSEKVSSKKKSKFLEPPVPKGNFVVTPPVSNPN